MSPKVSEKYKQEKKTELLQAALKVFIHKGYTQAAMQDIMDEAGVSRGALYAYFDNIEHVFMEVLQFEDRRVLQFFEPDEHSPLWNQLTEWVRKQQQHIEAIHHSLLRARAEFFLSSAYLLNKEHFPYIAQRYRSLAEAIGRFVRLGAERGEFQPRMQPESIALFFISCIDGLMLDTYQLGAERTQVGEQLGVFIFSLRELLRPVTDDQS